MTKHMRGVHVAQVPMRAMFVMSVSAVALLLNLLFMHSANALPLGAERLLGPITQLLPSSAPAQQPVQSDTTNGSAANTSASPSPSSANQSSLASPSTANLDAAPMAPEDVQPLTPLALIDTSDLKQPLLPLAYLASAKRDSRSVAAVASTTVATPLIQATEEGWQLFGVAWYWWLAAAAVTAGGFRYLSRNRPVASGTLTG